MSILLMNKPLDSSSQHFYWNNSSDKFYLSSISNSLSPTTPSEISSVEKLELCSIAVYLILVLLFFLLFSKYTKAKSRNVKDSEITIPKWRHRFSIGIPLLDGVYTLHTIKTVGVRIIDEWCKKVGPFFQIPVGPVNVYCIGDASIAQKILSSSQPTHLNKPGKLYDRLLVEWFQDGLVNSDYEVWSPHRKILSRCFTYKSLQHYLKIMNKHGKILANQLSSVAIETKTGDNYGDSGTAVVTGEQIHEMIYFQVIKIIAQIVMGADDKFSEKTLNEWTHNYRSFKYLVVQRFLNPFLFIPPYWYFHPMKKEYERHRKYITEFFHNIIPVYRREHDKEIKTSGKTTSVKSDNDVGERHFRCVIEEMLCCDATDKEIYDEVGTIIGTGHETIIVSIQMLLLHLALNREHQVKCRHEIDRLFSEKTGLAENDDQMELTMDDLTQLKYMERCVLESLRITPSVPMFLRRLDAPISIGDSMELETGSNLVLMPWVIHRSSQYYSNPEKFDPDRFLPENVKKRHPYAFIPFSAGNRNCIGYKMALLEIRVIMMWILRNFEVESNDKLEDVQLNFEVTLTPERNYNLVFRKRWNI